MALVPAEQTTTRLQEQFRILECEHGMTEQNYLAECCQPDGIILLKKERERLPRPI
jgi:hypothetical protein